MLYRQPLFQLISAALIFGSGAIFVVFIALDATVIAFYRMFIPTILFAAFLILKRHSFVMSKKALLYAIGAGIFLGADLAMWNSSILIVGPGIATILNSLQVFFMAGIGILFYKNPSGRLLWVSLILTFLGVILLCSNEVHQTTNGGFGVFIGIISAVMFALYMACLRESAQHQTHSVAATQFYVSLSGALALGVFAALQGSSFAFTNLQSFSMILFYGGIVHVGAMLLMTIAMPHLTVAVIGMVMCLEPVAVLLIDILFLDKAISIWQYVGAILTIFAVYLGTQSTKKPKNSR